MQRKSGVSHAKFLSWKPYHLNDTVSLSVSLTRLNFLSKGIMSYFFLESLGYSTEPDTWLVLAHHLMNGGTNLKDQAGE